ncbi:MAG: ATP-binding protein [Opitutaceae bacterium]|nr:ATP-binding protein [Opitutaceae bacterium]
MPQSRIRLRLETKVMITVVAALIALPTVTLWLVDQRLREQMQLDADLALSTAKGSFEQALKLRSEELAMRFRTWLQDSRLLTILRLGDPATTQDFLQTSVLDEYRDDTDFALIVTSSGELRGARREGVPVTLEAFGAAAEPLIRAAMQGEERGGELSVNGTAYHAVAVPVRPPGVTPSALVFGMRITDTALRKVRPPSSQILVVVGNQVVASTLVQPTQNDTVLRQLADNAMRGRDNFVLLGGARHQPVTGVLDVVAPAQQPIRYVLLWSAEQGLAAFERTRTTLLALSAAGILVSAVVVWFFVRRITRPLVDLRDRAEAVGRGDFSQRIERFSNDEVGELAVAFNQMMANLQISRAELERAMQQVKLTQAQLIQSEKLSAVGQFVAGVAHELNNPLTAVVGFSELLQSQETDAKTHGHLDRIAKSAMRCHKIVQSLLGFARQHPPERKQVNLHQAIDEVLEIMAYDFRTSNVTVEREFAADLPLLMADGHQLQQVFVNIMGNARQAIEAVEREGRIVIRTRWSGSLVLIEFCDNGPGIDPENLARIFDPFFTTKPVGKGTGLGLSLCYGIVQEHGGRITAKSDVGHGATFTIELPINADLAPSPLARKSTRSPFEPAVEMGPSGRSVLVIDDEQWILDLASELLRAEGHRVEMAVGGQQALEIIGRQKFDVIVSDWKMPGLNGIRLFEHLRATDPALAKRVLFMTGDVVNDSFQDFLRQNELTCLSKPFATGEFRAAVEKVFGEK